MRQLVLRETNMKIVTASIIALLLWTASAGAVDIVAAFGPSMVPCVLAATKGVIKADNADYTMITLTDRQNNPITTPVDVVNARNNQTTKAVTFPSLGFKVTASTPGDWVLTISSPVYSCTSVEITAVP